MSLACLCEYSSLRGQDMRVTGSWVQQGSLGLIQGAWHQLCHLRKAFRGLVSGLASLPLCATHLGCQHQDSKIAMCHGSAPSPHTQKRLHKSFQEGEDRWGPHEDTLPTGSYFQVCPGTFLGPRASIPVLGSGHPRSLSWT